MKTSTLTDRVLSILSSKPMASVDVWDAIDDSDVRMSDVVSELHALCGEGRAMRGAPKGLTATYCLAAQAVAS
jgi:hypothetical protein